MGEWRREGGEGEIKTSRTINTIFGESLMLLTVPATSSTTHVMYVERTAILLLSYSVLCLPSRYASIDLAVRMPGWTTTRAAYCPELFIPLAFYAAPLNPFPPFFVPSYLCSPAGPQQGRLTAHSFPFDLLIFPSSPSCPLQPSWTTTRMATSMWRS